MPNLLKLQVKDKKNKIISNGSIEIKNQTDTSAELYFYGDICSESWQSEWYDEDKCPKDVKDFLDQLEGVSDIDIHINSGGGSVYGGIAIYNLLKRYNATITTYIDGIAASIASVIACAGDKIIIPSNATFMIHKPYNGYFFTCMNADELRKDADALDSCQKAIVNIYMSKVKEGVTEDKINELINDETWFIGSEVSEYFNFDIEESNDAVACDSYYFDKYNHAPKNLIKNDNTDTDKVFNESDIKRIVNQTIQEIKDKENEEKQKIKDSLLKDLDQYGK